MNAKNLRRAGFTLIELLIVISIIGLLAVAFIPDLMAGQETAKAAADQKNLSQHGQWLGDYERRVKHLPSQGGHKFLLDLWVRKVVSPQIENLDRFFSPGLSDDPHWHELRKKVELGEPIWQSLDEVSSRDTHYAARAEQHILGMNKAGEAWVANDNEFGWVLQDGTVNVLLAGNVVRSYSLQQLMENYKWPGVEQVFPTFGENSPMEMLKKLDK